MTCPKSHSNLVVEPRQELPVLSVLCLVTQVCSTLCDPMDCSPPDSSVHGDFPCKDTRVGFHALLQEIFPTQGSNSDLQHCRQILYRLLSCSFVRIYAQEWDCQITWQLYFQVFRCFTLIYVFGCVGLSCSVQGLSLLCADSSYGAWASAAAA